MQAESGHRCVVGPARCVRAATGTQTDGGERGTGLQALAVPCIVEGHGHAGRRPARPVPVCVGAQVLAHPDRTHSQKVGGILGRRLMPLPGLDPAFVGLVHRHRQLQREYHVPGDGLGADPGKEFSAGVAPNSVALAVRLDRGSLIPCAGCPLQRGTGGEIGRHDPDVRDQSVHECFDRPRQATLGAGRIAELDSGAGTLERGPVDWGSAVETFPDFLRKRCYGAGEELIGIHVATPRDWRRYRGVLVPNMSTDRSSVSIGGGIVGCFFRSGL